MIYVNFNHIFLAGFRPQALGQNGRYIPENNRDLIGWLMCLVAFSLSSSPILVVVAVIFEHWDCTAFIMEDILPDAMYRDLRIVYLTIVVRFILVAPSVIEVIRGLTHYLLHGIVFITGLLKSLKFLQTQAKTTQEFTHYYNCLMIAHGCIERLSNNLMCLIVTVDYWGTIGAIWFCIQGYEKIELVMYSCLVGGTLMALILSAISLPKLKYISGMINEMMEKHTIRAKYGYIFRKSRKSRAVLAEMKGLRRLTLKFGPFHPFEEDYVMEYFSGVEEKVIDYVLMIEL